MPKGSNSRYTRTRIGTTRPLVYLGTGWFVGIALASALHLPIEILLPAFLVPIGGLLLWRHDQRIRLIWFNTMAAVLGALWFTLRLPHFDQNSLSTYNEIGVVTIEGVIDADPDVRDTYINLRINADRLTTPDRSARPIEGIVLVRPSHPAEFRYGDRVRVTGQLSAPPEFPTFNIQQILPEPQASLLSSILLGIEAGLPLNVQGDLRATGTTHIIAISG